MILYKLVDRFYRSILVSGRYNKAYIPRSVVYAEPNTLGLMLFDSYKGALSFYGKTKHALRGKPLFKILAVRGIGQETIPTLVSLAVNEKYLDDFYDHVPQTAHLVPPPGTVCFQSVEVLYQVGPSLDL